MDCQDDRWQEPIDEEYFEQIGADDYYQVDVIDPLDLPLPSAWSSDLSEIPFDVEVTVAWNFTNSTHTKSIVIRHSDTPGILWLDNLQHQFITIEDARYWIGYPELPKD